MTKNEINCTFFIFLCAKIEIIMKNIAIFASGAGTNAENIAEYFSKNEKINVALVVSNRLKAGVHERAARLHIPSITFSKTDFEDGGSVIEILQEYHIDLVVLAGFMNKISNPVMQAFPEKIVNIHPSLLPKYGGKGMYGMHVHEAVVAAGEKESGITIHYINEHYDEGTVIFQTSCELLPTDTPEDVAAKVHALEYAHYPRVIERLLARQAQEIL